MWKVGSWSSCYGVAKYQSTVPLQWHTVHGENLRRNCIEVTIATGHCKGSDVFLPRIPLIPSDASIPFEFKWLQFPV